MATKLSKAQQKVLDPMAVTGARLRHASSVISEEWYWTHSGSNVNLRTGNALADRGYIAPLQSSDLSSEYVITDAGRAALNGVKS